MAASDLPATYDDWRTSPPDPDPFACVVCGNAGFDQQTGDTPYLTDEGEVVCSWACHTVDAARHAEGVEATLQAVIRAMDEGAELRVYARCDGGCQKYTGSVIDWSRDGERITIRSDALRCGKYHTEIKLHRTRLKELRVL